MPQRMSREAKCVALEQKHVHDVYARTAHHFQEARYKAWPQVKQFLLDLEPGALVADVGCGTGKYLHINKGIMKLGSDFCSKLASIAHQRHHEVMVCDNLHLPYRDDCMDAVISIGVIHHMTTVERRTRAVQEIARVLRPGGKVMIYVWAMEQSKRKFDGQDVLVPWHLQPKNQTKKPKDKNSTRKRSERITNTCNDECLGNSVRNTDHGDSTVGSVDSNTSNHKIGKQQHKLERTDALTVDSPEKDVTSQNGSSVVFEGVSSEKENLEKLKPPTKSGAGLTLSNAKGETSSIDNGCDEDGLVVKHKEERSSSLPDILRNHFMNLFGNKFRPNAIENKEHESKSLRKLTAINNFNAGRTPSAVEKDMEYKNLIQKIALTQSDLLAEMSRPVLQHSYSNPDSEVFQVREFPQSSQPTLQRQASDSIIEARSRNNSLISNDECLVFPPREVKDDLQDSSFTCKDNPNTVDTGGDCHISRTPKSVLTQPEQNGKDKVEWDSHGAKSDFIESMNCATNKSQSEESVKKCVQNISHSTGCQITPNGAYPESPSDFVSLPDQSQSTIDNNGHTNEYISHPVDLQTWSAKGPPISGSHLIKPVYPEEAQSRKSRSRKVDKHKGMIDYNSLENTCDTSTRIARNKLNNLYDAKADDPQMAEICAELNSMFDKETSRTTSQDSIDGRHCIYNSNSDGTETRSPPGVVDIKCELDHLAANCSSSQVNSKQALLHDNDDWCDSEDSPKEAKPGNPVVRKDDESDSDEWKKLTAQAIHSMQYQVLRSSEHKNLPVHCHVRKPHRSSRSRGVVIQSHKRSSQMGHLESSGANHNKADACNSCSGSRKVIPPHSTNAQQKPVLKRLTLKSLDQSSFSSDAFSESSSDVDDSGICTCMCSFDEKPDSPNHLNMKAESTHTDSPPKGVEEAPDSSKKVESPEISEQEKAENFKRFYHVFKEEELVDLINKHVPCLNVVEAYYDHANWCVVAEKINLWTI